MITEIINSILAPNFLVNKISLIALILGATILVIFSDFVNKNIVFPLAGYLKQRTASGIKKTKTHKKIPWFSKLASESAATILFLLYCYLGSSFLAEYLFAPILFMMRNIILLVVIVLFFLISYTINSKFVKRNLIKF